MGFHTIAGAAFRALTARKDGPSLYDVCDPVLLKYQGGDPHLGKFYRTAIGAPVADLLDTIELSHPKPARATPAHANGAAPTIGAIERVIHGCAAHLCARSAGTTSFRPMPPST